MAYKSRSSQFVHKVRNSHKVHESRSYWVWNLDLNHETLFGSFTWSEMCKTFELPPRTQRIIRLNAGAPFTDHQSRSLYPEIRTIRIIPTSDLKGSPVESHTYSPHIYLRRLKSPLPDVYAKTLNWWAHDAKT